MDLIKTRTSKCGTFTFTLRGDGSICPELQIQGERGAAGQARAYVNADILRAMAKQLNKWAKKLEEHVA